MWAHLFASAGTTSWMGLSHGEFDHENCIDPFFASNYKYITKNELPILHIKTISPRHLSKPAICVTLRNYAVFCSQVWPRRCVKILKLMRHYKATSGLLLSSTTLLHLDCISSTNRLNPNVQSENPQFLVVNPALRLK